MSQERSRKFAQTEIKIHNGTDLKKRRVSRSQLIKYLGTEIVKFLLPRAEEVPHNSQYLSRSKAGSKEYESQWVKHPLKSRQAYKNAQFETARPITVFGRRVHKLVPLIAIGAFLVFASIVHVIFF